MRSKTALWAGAVAIFQLGMIVGSVVTLLSDRQWSSLQTPFPWDYEQDNQVIEFHHNDNRDLIAILRSEITDPPPGYVHYATLTERGEDLGLQSMEVRWVIYRKAEGE